MSVSNVLVVCTGNICRSPMAAAVLNAAAPWLNVHTAGLEALIGHPADRLAIELLDERGLDIRPHRAQQLNGWLGTHADLIFVMETVQKLALERRYPILTGRVFRLAHHARTDIHDPYRQGRAAFEGVLASIDAAVEQWSACFASLAGPGAERSAKLHEPSVRTGKRQNTAPIEP